MSLVFGIFAFISVIKFLERLFSKKEAEAIMWTRWIWANIAVCSLLAMLERVTQA